MKVALSSSLIMLEVLMSSGCCVSTMKFVVFFEVAEVEICFGGISIKMLG